MKTLLSFDGGGVRGAISVAFLQEIERLMMKGGSDSLCNSVDLVGGTSTGAIIAGTVALGYSATDIRDFYLNLAPKVFRRSRFRIRGIQSVFDAVHLRREIMQICGERTLGSSDLKTGFALVMKRMDTGSPWILSNNPASKFWDDPPDKSYLGNQHYRLADLIRASTAAPHYFQPQSIHIADGEPPGLFVDGGVTPHNNPALALLQMVTVPGYAYNWPVGADKLRIISIGTGTFRDRLDAKKSARLPAAGLAVKALAGLIADSQNQTLMLMQMLGRTLTKWPINSEVGDLNDFVLPREPLFEFVRYDVKLERIWLKETLDIDISRKDLDRVRKMDNPDMISLAYDIGTTAAKKMVKPEHLPR